MVAALAEGLVGLGHELRVLCAHTEARASQEVLRGVTVERLASPWVLASQPLMCGLWKNLQAQARWADLIHIHSPNPLVEFYSLFLHKPIVVTYHADVVRQRLLLPLYAPIRKRFLERAKLITVSSETLRQNSEVLAPFRAKTWAIPFGIEDPGSPDRSQSQKRVLFVGRFVPYKGLDILLEAAALSPYPITIAGSGPLESELRRMVSERNLRVDFEIEPSPERLRALYREAGLLVLPSRTVAEAFGMVLVEGLAHGLPLISTDLPTGVREVNEAGVTGIMVPKENPKELAKAIDTILSDEALARKMGSAGRERFESRYAAAVMAKSFSQVYQEVPRG